MEKNITIINEVYEKKEGTKTVWILKEIDTYLIDEVYYNNVVSKETLRFFRGLGGYERAMEGYTKRGKMITKVISINPGRDIKVIRKFEF